MRHTVAFGDYGGPGNISLELKMNTFPWFAMRMSLKGTTGRAERRVAGHECYVKNKRMLNESCHVKKTCELASACSKFGGAWALHRFSTPFSALLKNLLYFRFLSDSFIFSPISLLQYLNVLWPHISLLSLYLSGRNELAKILPVIFLFSHNLWYETCKSHIPHKRSTDDGCARLTKKLENWGSLINDIWNEPKSCYL